MPTNKLAKKNWIANHKTVLIELQKAKKPKDIERFRRYLGDQETKFKDLFFEECT